MNISPINSNYSYQSKPAFKAVLVKKLEPVLKQECVTFYNNATAMLDKPLPLFTGVRTLINALIENEKQGKEMLIDKYDVSRMFEMLKFLPEKLFENRKVLGIIGAGMNVTALQLDNHEVLSLSDNMDSFNARNFEDFDLPIKSSGQYFKKCTQEGWYIREQGEPVTKRELQELGDRIMSKGYCLEDWRTEQACKVNGKTYLLDFECASIQNNPKSFLLGFF